MDIQTVPRMRHLWKDMRQKALSFFACVEEVRKEIGDVALEEWCRRELLIGLDAITKARLLLKDVDAIKAKEDLAKANKIAAEKARQEKEAAKRKRDLEKAEHDAALAEIRKREAIAEQEAVRIRLETKQQERTEKKKEKQRKATKERTKQKQNKPHERGEQASNSRRVRESKGNLPSLLKQLRKIEKREENNREDWIIIHIQKAKLLCAIRDCHPSNEAFSAWLEQNDVKINADDRSALINLGRIDEPRLRQIFTETESRSPQLIWRSLRPIAPELKVVS